MNNLKLKFSSVNKYLIQNDIAVVSCMSVMFMLSWYEYSLALLREYSP
jgi:hypothetical protein